MAFSKELQSQILHQRVGGALDPGAFFQIPGILES